MIAYHILCHGNFPQVARLMESLYSPEDTFLIDMDDGQAPDTRAIEKLFRRDNIHIKSVTPITAGGQVVRCGKRWRARLSVWI